MPGATAVLNFDYTGKGKKTRSKQKTHKIPTFCVCYQSERSVGTYAGNVIAGIVQIIFFHGLYQDVPHLEKHSKILSKCTKIFGNS